ncbi:polysaccharide biosynthesis tyrosine autokinase [Thiohalomonas denitrificans]|uniref:Tyrosine-protein kinase Etk/Wzc n=1 Tax=Thiohalomonas denitrificans TaxID=415747 RepID=A0A1G5Q7S5_9GAMM|nr:polysaccharide biosynthesis tyrosine autokinase [Thiohalomonas denitrificans]SCZ57935.1 tyrosine-protein kinase Etk/Wzc [Thiohalomonas denitrificans]
MDMRNNTAEGAVREPEYADDEIDLGELLAHLIDAKWLIAGIAAAITALAGIYAFTATPIYQSDVLLQVEEQSASIGGMDEFSSMFGTESPAAAEIEIIKSRTIGGQAVDELGLDIAVQPNYFPLIGAAVARLHGQDNGIADSWLGLDSYAWGGEVLGLDRLELPSYLINQPLTLIAGDSGTYRLLDEEGRELLAGSVDKPAEARGAGGERIGIFVSRLEARPGTTFVVTKRPRWQVAQDLRDQLSVSEQGKGTGVIRVGLEHSDPQRLEQILSSVTNAYLRQNVERRSREAEKTLEFLNEQLPALKAELTTAESRLNDYRSEVGSVDLTLETQTFLQQAAEFEKALSELRLKRTELIEKFTPNHPVISSLEQKIEQLKAEQAALEAQIRELPEEQQHSLQFTRDVRVANELYMLLLNKSQEMRVVKAGTVGNARIIDPAYLPPEPVKPKKSLVLVLGLLLGIMAGVAAALLRRVLNKGVEDPDILEKQLGLPTFASILHSSREEQLALKKGKGKTARPLLALAERDDLAIEALRSLRTSLQFAAMDTDNAIITISGPSPGIGKSFISGNLAAVVADAGKRTLLIDADMRKGHLHEYFGIKRTRGLSELISGEVTKEEAVRPTEQANLDFLPSGIVPPNPAELLMSSRFQALMEEFKDDYDSVIIDTPPALAVTDASIVGRLSGMTFIVVRSGRHPLRELDLTVKRLQQSGVDVNGFIFNDVPLKSSRYGYGGYYGYAYQYSYK